MIIHLGTPKPCDKENATYIAWRSMALRPVALSLSAIFEIKEGHNGESYRD
jgi:hypothetical protein